MAMAASSIGFPAVVRSETSATAPLDVAMARLLSKHGIPGGALGIARAGKLVYAKGFGLASKERGTVVEAKSRFRIASVTKPFTAAAVLRLVEQGKLGLDEPVLPHLRLTPLNGDMVDARWTKVTIRHLLNHTGGWDKATSGDAMFKSREISRAAGIEGPADAETTVRWMLGRRLDFEPGTRFSYCNFGYCLLGRVVESVTGDNYESAMGHLVFSPCGIRHMDLGRTLSAQSDEVSYYHCDNTQGGSVFPKVPSPVPWPYGSFSLEANDANGGWIANVTDLLRFATALDERASSPLLKSVTLQAIYTSEAPGSRGTGAYQGLGWLVKPKGQGGRPDLWQVGGLPGTKTVLERLGDGFDWAVLFNSRPASFDPVTLDIHNSIHAAAREVIRWPETDLFGHM
ncbi:MAG: D-aminoacylase [Verrucomicrobiaceae bacterium]|nr:D-aminoacylase [Verrucomicrobiaceae bacterium]